MKDKMVTRLLVLSVICLLVVSACSLPYTVNTRGAPKSECAEIHNTNAEIVYVDGKMVSVSKVLWLFPAHVVITKGDHDISVNYWEKSVFSKSPKKIHFTAKPGKQYYAECKKVRAGKSVKKKSRDDKHLFLRKGGEYFKDGDGYLYTYECCLKDKATDETISCK